MRIAVDAMGGDHAPKNVIEGAVAALKEAGNDITLVLVGLEQPKRYRGEITTDTTKGPADQQRRRRAIDATNDDLDAVATNISLVTGVTATVASSTLSITADANYTFDFMPAVLPLPTANNLTGTPPVIAVSGIYKGDNTETLTFTVSGTDTIGNGTLQLVVTGDVTGAIATLYVGSDYSPGEKIAVGDTGISISLPMAPTTTDVNDAETFEVFVLADADTSGFLAAAGINTFFSGTDTSDIAVCSDISSTPGRLATSLGGDMTDNTNISRIAALKDVAVSSLSNLSPGEFYRRMVTDIGQTLSIKKIRQENIEVMVYTKGLGLYWNRNREGWG